MSPRNIALAFSFAAHLTTAFQPRILSPFIAASVVRRSSSSSVSMDSGLTLYGSQQTRSPLVNWYLEEKSIPFTQKAPRPSAHPFGQTPFLTDNGGVEVFESGAILLYIADAYGGNQLQTRPKLDSWLPLSALFLLLIAKADSHAFRLQHTLAWESAITSHIFLSPLRCTALHCTALLCGRVTFWSTSNPPRLWSICLSSLLTLLPWNWFIHFQETRPLCREHLTPNGWCGLTVN